MPTRTDDPPRTKPPEVAGESSSPLVASSAAAPAPTTPAEAHAPLTRETFQSVLSSQQRAGRWEAADEIEANAYFGSIVLDFTHADLPPSGEIEIEAFAFCGSIEIIVPDGAEIELEGTPIIGSIEQKLRKKRTGEAIREWVSGAPPSSPPVNPPFFRIAGRAICGSIEVKGR